MQFKSWQPTLPKPLILNRDAQGKPCHWAITDNQLHQAQALARDRAQQIFDKTLQSNPEIVNYVKDLGIDQKALQVTQQYIQWSIAAEISITNSTGTPQDQAKIRRPKPDTHLRGQLPTLAYKSIAKPLAENNIDFAMFDHSPTIAGTGTDLYTTLWSTIAGAINTIATACIKDQQHITGYPFTLRAILNYRPFSRILLPTRRAH